MLLPSSQTDLRPQSSVFPTDVVSVFLPTTGEEEEEQEEVEEDWEERGMRSKRGVGRGGRRAEKEGGRSP